MGIEAPIAVAAAEPIIEFERVVAGYSPSLTILNETTFDARRSEITLLIGKGAPLAATTSVEEAVRELEEKGIPRMDAIKQVARDRGLSKRDVYKQVT